MEDGLTVVLNGSLLYPLIQIFLFTFGVIGLTHIIVDSKIMSPVRAFLQKVLPPFLYLTFECYQCSGTWAGFLVGYMIMSHNIFTILVCGFAGSFLASWAAFYLNYLEAQTMVAMDKKDNTHGS